MIRGPVVAFSGIRAVDPSSAVAIEMAVLDAIGSGARELRFGGALGSDTIALASTGSYVKGRDRVVYVPFRVKDQPKQARRVIEAYADSFVELDLPRNNGAYHTRNRTMVGANGEKPVDLVIAFTDGREEGGTFQTMEYARSIGVPVSVVEVAAKRGVTAKRNPVVTGEHLATPVFAYKVYRRDALSGLVKRIKTGHATKREISELADKLVRFIKREPAFGSAQAIVAMPRRLPGAPSDMAPIAEIIAGACDLKVATLERVAEPSGGRVLAERLRFTAETHARTLRYKGPSGLVIVLDNVITSGGTMDGAGLAVERGGGGPVGLAVLVSESLGLEAE